MINFTPAPRFKRFLAIIIDMLVLAIVIFLLNFALFYLIPKSLMYLRPITFVNVIVIALYFILMEQSSWRATLGKKCLDLYVADVDGNRISLLKSLYRYFLYSVPAFPAYLLQSIRSEHVHTSVYNATTIERFGSGDYVSLMLVLIWFVPIFFNERAGVHDRLSGTRVFARRTQYLDKI